MTITNLPSAVLHLIKLVCSVNDDESYTARMSIYQSNYSGQRGKFRTNLCVKVIVLVRRKVVIVFLVLRRRKRVSRAGQELLKGMRKGFR